MDNMPDVDIPAISKEALHQSLDAVDASRSSARGLIKPVPWTDGVLLHGVCQVNDRRKRVAELDDTEGSDDGDKAKVVWNRRSDHKSHAPVNGDDGSKQVFAGFRIERRGIEDFLQNLVVQDFDADVTIQASRNQARNDDHHVAGRLEAIDAQPHVRDGKRILSLKVVDVASVDEVDSVDEELREPHGLDKIPRASHLGHDFDKELGTAVGEDAGHEAVDGANKVA